MGEFINILLIAIPLSILTGILLSSYVDKKVGNMYGKLLKEVYLRNSYQEEGTLVVGTCTDVEVKWFGRIHGEKIYLELTDERGYAKWVKVESTKLVTLTMTKDSE